MAAEPAAPNGSQPSGSVAPPAPRPSVPPPVNGNGNGNGAVAHEEAVEAPR